NNAYCQDNPISWIDWEELLRKNEELLGFVRRLIAFRNAHPALRRRRFMHGRAASEGDIKDITWYVPQGTEKTTEQWQDVLARCMGVLLNGQANPAIGRDGIAIPDDLLFIVLNSHHEPVDFVLPTLPVDASWERVLDTNDPELAQEPTTISMGATFAIPGRSLVVFNIPASEHAHE